MAVHSCVENSTPNINRCKMTRLAMTPKTFGSWFGAIWFFCGLPFLIIGLYLSIQHGDGSNHLNVEGRTIEGMVLTKSVRPSSSGSSRNTSPTYEITFIFLTPGGLVNGTAQVTSATWDGLVEREPSTITYLPDNPQRYHVQGQNSGWFLSVNFTGVGECLPFPLDSFGSRPRSRPAQGSACNGRG